MVAGGVRSRLRVFQNTDLAFVHGLEHAEATAPPTSLPGPGGFAFVPLKNVVLFHVLYHSGCNQCAQSIFSVMCSLPLLASVCCVYEFKCRRAICVCLSPQLEHFDVHVHEQRYTYFACTRFACTRPFLSTFRLKILPDSCLYGEIIVGWDMAGKDALRHHLQ